MRRRDKDAWSFCRRGIRPPDSHALRHGQPSERRKYQCDENSRNEHLAGVSLISSSCGSRPDAAPGINARPSRLALPGPPWPITIPVQTQNETKNGRRILSLPKMSFSLVTVSDVLVLVDDASRPVASPDSEGLEVGYLAGSGLSGAALDRAM